LFSPIFFCFKKYHFVIRLKNKTLLAGVACKPVFFFSTLSFHTVIILKGSTIILMECLFLCPYAGLAFHFFLDKKTKQKNQGLQ